MKGVTSETYCKYTGETEVCLRTSLVISQNGLGICWPEVYPLKSKSVYKMIGCGASPSHPIMNISSPQKLNRMYTTQGWRYSSSVKSGEQVCSHYRASQINQTLINQVLKGVSQHRTTVCIMAYSLIVGTMKICPKSWWGRMWWWSGW